MKKKNRRVMRGTFNRTLSFAAGVAAILAAAAPSWALASSDAGKVSAITAPAPRLANSFSLDLPAVMPGASIGPQDLSRYAVGEVEAEFALLDGVGVVSGVNTDVPRLLDRYAPSADGFDGMFISASAASSPYLSLSNGGSYAGTSLTLADDLHLDLGLASSTSGLNPYRYTPRLAVARLGGAPLPYDARGSKSSFAGLSWNFAKWGGLGFTASQTTEQNGALGMNNAAIDSARTSALGLSAHVGFGGGWVTTAAYSEGTTQLSLKSGALGSGTEMNLHSESYGIAVAKHGLFGNDALGVAFSRPAPSDAVGSLSSSSSNDMQFQFFGRDKLFAGTKPETDIELGYITTFLNGPVALQANASYQMNMGGQNGNNGVSLLSRAKIKF